MTVQAVTPTRILDTRPATAVGAHVGNFTANETYAMPVLGKGAVPMYGVAAVMANVTAVPNGGGGYLTLFASGRPRPTASNVNFSVAGQAVANQVLVPVGPDGSVSIYCSAADVRVIVDINGWVPSELGAPVGPSSPFAAPTGPVPGDTAQAQQILANAVRYLLGPWWAGPAQTLLTAQIGPGDPSPNHDAVRRMAMAALALATSRQLGGAGDPAVATLLIDRAASTHFVNTPGGWGEWWQSTMWAGILGRAAWTMWSDLGVSVQRRVAKVVEFEAGWALRQNVKYLRNKAGTVLSPGDSGAEEVSWQALPLQVAAVMLPDHPMRPHWLNAMTHLALAAWARPVDANALTVVNGRALTTWLGGSNVEADGSVVNHGRPAPDYATCLYQNLDAVPLLLQAGQPIPRALVALLGPVYAAIEASYSPTGVVNYALGNEWGTGQIIPFALVDALAQTCGFGSGAYLDMHLDAVLAQQARHPDGHMYEPGEYVYEGAEEHAAQLAAQLLLALVVRDQHSFQFDDSPSWI